MSFFDFFTVDDPRATRRLRLQLASTFIVVALACGTLVEYLEHERVAERQAQARLLLQTSLHALGQRIDQSLSATYAIGALIHQARGAVPEEFDQTAQQILSLFPGVSAIQLAPGGVIRRSIPLAGNEGAIGHDLLKDPSRTKEAFLARDTRQLTLAGPFKLVQGGLGAAGRLPIFLAGPSGEERFWGFTTVLIRFPDVLREGGLDRLRDAGFEFRLWRVHPDSADIQTIASSGPIAPKDPISENLAVPNGVWTLSAAPIGGWSNPTRRALDLALALAATLAISAFAVNLLRRPVVLRQEVERRTAALRDSEARFESLFEQSPVALSVTTNADGYVSSRWNKAWLEWSGYAPSQAQGRSGNEIGLWVVPGERDRYIEAARAQGEVRDMETRMRRADGEERLVQVSGRFIQTGNGTLLLTHYHDVTDKRRADEAVKELNATLEARVEKRTQELKKSNAELWRVVTMLEKTQKELLHSEKMASLATLVAGVAHELNTPIGNGVTMSSTLEAKLADFKREVESGLRRSTLDRFMADLTLGLDVMLKNLLRAGELISSFKQVAVDQASQTRRSFHLDSVVGEIVTTLRPSLKRTAIRIEIDVPTGLVFDSYPGPLGQVLVNLVNNAVLHGFENGSPGVVKIVAERLHAPDTDESNPWVRLIVEDNGVGVPSAVLPRIFDPFFTTKLGSGGTGLGLNICYNIVTSLLGGRINANSTPGQGTKMTIDLPLVAPATDSEA